MALHLPSGTPSLLHCDSLCVLKHLCIFGFLWPTSLPDVDILPLLGLLGATNHCCNLETSWISLYPKRSALSPSPLFWDLVKRPEPVPLSLVWKCSQLPEDVLALGVFPRSARRGLTRISHPGNQPQHPLIQCHLVSFGKVSAAFWSEVKKDCYLNWFSVDMRMLGKLLRISLLHT